MIGIYEYKIRDKVFRRNVWLLESKRISSAPQPFAYISLVIMFNFIIRNNVFNFSGNTCHNFLVDLNFHTFSLLRSSVAARPNELNPQIYNKLYLYRNAPTIA